MTAEEKWFWQLGQILAPARGKAAAITIARLTELASIPDRRITEHILQTRYAEFPFPLVSGAKGYWIPTEADDINRYIHSLHSRHRELQRRERACIRKCRVAGFPWSVDSFTDPPPSPDLFSSVTRPRSPISYPLSAISSSPSASPAQPQLQEVPT